MPIGVRSCGSIASGIAASSVAGGVGTGAAEDSLAEGSLAEDWLAEGVLEVVAPAAAGDGAVGDCAGCVAAGCVVAGVAEVGGAAWDGGAASAAAGVLMPAFCASAAIGVETGSRASAIRAIAAGFDTARDARSVLDPPVLINVMPKALYVARTINTGLVDGDERTAVQGWSSGSMVRVKAARTDRI